MKEKITSKTLVDSKALDNYRIIDFLNASSIAMFVFSETGEILAFNNAFKYFYPEIFIGDSINRITQSQKVQDISTLLQGIEKNNGTFKEIIFCKNGLTLECSLILLEMSFPIPIIPLTLPCLS